MGNLNGNFRLTSFESNLGMSDPGEALIGRWPTVHDLGGGGGGGGGGPTPTLLGGGEEGTKGNTRSPSLSPDIMQLHFLPLPLLLPLPLGLRRRHFNTSPLSSLYISEELPPSVGRWVGRAQTWQNIWPAEASASSSFLFYPPPQPFARVAESKCGGGGRRRICRLV